MRLAAEVCWERGLPPYPVSLETIRQALKRVGVNWWRATRGITRHDLALYTRGRRPPPIPNIPLKKHRDRLIHLAAQHPDGVLGFADETWWSRLAQPALHSWTAGKPLRLNEQELPKGGIPDPKALACYGLLWTDANKVWRRFVDGRPVSHVTTAFLAWVCERLAQEHKRVLALVWDNASWHISRETDIQRTDFLQLLLKILREGPWQNDFISVIRFIEHLVYHCLEIMDFLAVEVNEDEPVIGEEFA
jgi:hypothetical protein